MTSDVLCLWSYLLVVRNSDFHSENESSILSRTTVCRSSSVGRALPWYGRGHRFNSDERLLFLVPIAQGWESTRILSGRLQVPIAQLDRASVYETEGWKFDSS